MTNEVANCVEESARASNCLMSELESQLTKGQELWDAVLTWFTEHGISFAIDLLVAALMLVAGMLAIRLIRRAAEKALSKVEKMNNLLSDFLVGVVGKVCWAVLALLVIQRLGINVGPLIAGLGITGFILGFAFQETLGSFAAGMMIALNQPFKVGDYVVAGGVEGVVRELNMMATVFSTADNKKVVVPNKVIWGSAITNFTALGKRRVDTKISIAYGADIRKAVEVAKAAIAKIPQVLADPAPVVAVASLDDSAVTVNLRPWAACEDYWTVYSAVQETVKKAFEDNGISIPFPQIDVHMV